MFELFFIIILEDDSGFREKFTDKFNTRQECIDTGWERAVSYSDQIMQRYPTLKNFNVECDRTKQVVRADLAHL